ncbi:hypothetical protein SLS55_002310 [Diplodia seriata]|uniref:FCP1 homology domain-containing protein n=1 Tax=Diplodia seriata TaxID=420778 RepID=A0ABR3CRU1_9PEZI
MNAHQQATIQQFSGRGTPPTGPRFQSRGHGRNSGQRGGQHPPVRSSANSQPVAPRRDRPTPTGPSAGASPRPFGKDDFPTLGMGQPRQPAPRQQLDVVTGPPRQQAPQAPEGQARPSSSRGRGRFVPFTDFNPSSAPPLESKQRQAATQPPPRRRRNPAFQVSLSECYRGKVIFIDDLPGLDYSGHPAIVRSIDPVTQTIKFFKKSSFKNIGGFMEKYGEYVNQSQKKWHEKQWLLVDDGSTKPHHGTPLLRLANGEKMPEKGSYVDIHGDTELHIDYFSKYSRFGVFPDLFLPEEEMRTLENYSRWYLGKDREYREAEEKKKREKWQMDGSADVDIGDIYEDSENESAR